MNAATFDTYTAAKHLRDAGFDERQAEAAVSMVCDAVGAGREQLATKADLAEVRADIADLKADMLKVAIGVAIGVVIANATLTAVLVFGALRQLQP